MIHRRMTSVALDEPLYFALRERVATVSKREKRPVSQTELINVALARYLKIDHTVTVPQRGRPRT